ncbi:nucleotidyltransferase domain-containing protein [Candidatus Woesearchaeota archaeon]|nr:nucleotidyltransferase domain-containing protein [Candidatus Woesearchaeota archaeon]
MTTKLVQKFGNSGHIVLPKGYVGKRIRFIAEPKAFEDIKSEILEILKPYLQDILGVYLYGSYARNEQTIDSDVDVLVITNTKLKIIDKINDYTIVSATLKELENTLGTNAVLILPIIKEAKTIINPDLLEKYKGYAFTKKNTKDFVDGSIGILELNKKGLELDFEIGSLVYSLILRIRGLLMIKVIINKASYSKSLLFDYLENYNFSKEKIEELYKIYSSERDNTKVKESWIITKEDIRKLIIVAENLLKEAKRMLK